MTKRESDVLERVSSDRFAFISFADRFASNLVDKTLLECNSEGIGSIKICLESERYPLQMAANYLNSEFSRRGYNTRIIENGVIIGNDCYNKEKTPSKICRIDDYL